MRPAVVSWLSWVPLIAATACVLGFWRAKLEFEGDRGLTGVDALRVALPDTPLPVRGCDPAVLEVCPQRVRYAGTWHSVGGSESEAKETTKQARLAFQKSGRFATLTAVLELQAQDLLDLEMTEIVLPADRDLELVTGVGDVDVADLRGAVSVDIDAGDVRIDGGDGGIAVFTGNGEVRVSSAGIVDVFTGDGAVTLLQTGGVARDVFIATERGDVVLELASDANLDLVIEAAGRIEVQTTTITTITSGFFARSVGNGSNHVEIFTDFGDVEVRLFVPG